MAKVTWITPSKDDPIYNGQFVISSIKFSPESAPPEESAEGKVSTGNRKKPRKQTPEQKKPNAKNKPLGDLS